MNEICVYCGSSFGLSDSYCIAAKELAYEMARRDIGLVYGGGTPGLMGLVADTMLEAGGRVTGVITRYLRDKELAHPNLTRLHVAESMHERKALMAHLSDGFIAMPGGLGTLEEIVEMISWAQLDLHHKPCGFLNVDRFFDGLVGFFDHATEQCFVRPEHRSMIMLHGDSIELLNAMESYTAPEVSKFGIDKYR